MIPAEAFEAARKVAFERYGTKPDAAYLRTILEAAAPYLLAQGWDEGVAYVFEGGAEVSDENPHRTTMNKETE